MSYMLYNIDICTKYCYIFTFWHEVFVRSVIGQRKTIY